MYHLKIDATLVESLRAVANDQIESAMASLESADDNLEEAVHDARKRFKKIRALVRLVRPGLGDTYDLENRFFRDVGRRLSDIRDSQVMIETVERLANQEDDANAIGELLAPVRTALDDRRKVVLENKNIGKRIANTLEDLEIARSRVGGWELEEPGVESLRGGLKPTYQRARKRHVDSLQAPEPEVLHDWRKRVKYHLYHCRLMREAWPEAMAARVDALDELADLLGDDHDLVVLSDLLIRGGLDNLPDANVLVAVTLASKRIHALRKQAFASAPRLFIEKPGNLADRLATTWAVTAVANA